MPPLPKYIVDPSHPQYQARLAQLIGWIEANLEEWLRPYQALTDEADKELWLTQDPMAAVIVSFATWLTAADGTDWVAPP